MKLSEEAFTELLPDSLISASFRESSFGRFFLKATIAILATMAAGLLTSCTHIQQSSDKKVVENFENNEKQPKAAAPKIEQDLSKKSEDNLAGNVEVSPEQSHWFKGSFPEALRHASKSKKLVFVYWGAEWCPPCNDLKDQVFSHPEFPELMKNYIAVYLDGDSANAQALGETLNVSGYPTMLLLNPKGQELFRLNAGYDFITFKETLVAESSNTGGLKAILGKLGKKKKLTISEWKSLMMASIDSESLGLSPEKTEELIINLWKRCPSEYIEAKSIFAANLWGNVTDETAKLKFTFKENEDDILEQVFASGMTMDAARSQLTGGAKDKILLLRPENKEKIRHLLSTYLKGISEDRNRSPSERASAMVSLVDLEKLSPRFNQNQLISYAQVVIDSILAESKSSHEKSATFPEIAAAYHELYGPEKAASFLESKIPEVKTPWYLETMLANLESQQNHKEKALMWSEKANQSSKGTATRLQWLSKDIVLKKKYLKSDDTLISDAIRRFLAESANTADAFKGRNQASHKRVAEVIKSLGSDGAELSTEALKLCGENFTCNQIYQNN